MYNEEFELYRQSCYEIARKKEVEGEGINSVTGEKIKFITRQTGF